MIGLGAQFSAPMDRRLRFHPLVVVFLVDAGSFEDTRADLNFTLHAH